MLREYRRVAGLPQHRLATLIDLTQAAISQIEAGKRQVTSAAVIQRIADGLDVPAELRGLPPRPSESVWAPDPEVLARIARAHTTQRADVRVAEHIADVLAAHRRAEDTAGGIDLWEVVRAQLDAVTGMLPATSGPTADRLLILAAEHAHWLSWVADKHGQPGAALTWLDLGYGWAVDAGSADMISWLTRVRSRYTLLSGDPARALRTAEAAQHAPLPLSPGAAAIATHQVALAAAAVGERDRASRLADESYTLALRVPAEAERPGWLYWMDPTRAILLRGEAACAARDWSTARDAFQEGLPGLTGFPRDHAFYAAQLADAQAHI